MISISLTASGIGRNFAMTRVVFVRRDPGSVFKGVGSIASEHGGLGLGTVNLEVAP